MQVADFADGGRETIWAEKVFALPKDGTAGIHKGTFARSHPKRF